MIHDNTNNEMCKENIMKIASSNLLEQQSFMLHLKNCIDPSPTNLESDLRV